jgi:hypothetical protein
MRMASFESIGGALALTDGMQTWLILESLLYLLTAEDLSTENV